MPIPTPNVPLNPLAKTGGRFIASAFGQWSATLANGGAVGANTFNLNISPVVAASDGTPFTPFATTAPLTIGFGLASAETVTPSAVSYVAFPGGVQVTVTTANVHNAGETVISGSAGLQEAINVANFVGGGTVMIDQSYTGTAAQINAATGFNQVALEDVRTGVNSRPSKIALTGAGAVCPVMEGTFVITTAGVNAVTLAAPTAGIDDGKVLAFTTTTANAHTVTVGAGKINGLATGKLTWTAAVGNGATLVAYQGVYYTLSLNGVTPS